MSNNRVLLSVFTVVAVVSMASEAATAQLFSGRLLGRRNAACCNSAPAATPAPVLTAAAAPAAPCCGGAASIAAPAPTFAAASPATVLSTAPAPSIPVATSPVAAPCCGGAAPAVVSSDPVFSSPVVSEPFVSSPVISQPFVSAPVSNCCGGGIVSSPSIGVPVEGTVLNVESLPIEGTVVSGETILESSEPTAAVQASPSDSTVTSDVVQPPVAADSAVVAPGEGN